MNEELERWLRVRPEEAAGTSLAVGGSVGEWKVRAFLGAGLSAEVYLVTNLRFGQEGALKLLKGDVPHGLRERFLAESDALRFLSLRALPRFMGSGEWNGRLYYVMECLRPLPDPLPRRDVAPFMNRVAKAVQMLHEAGYIHRDLKPGNILMRADGEPVLIDLGLIKRRGQRGADCLARQERGVSVVDGRVVGVGTLDFAAPEQLLKGEATVQSDVFALGKILRSLYEGRPPGNVRPVIQRATREVPQERYASANAFAAALRHRNRRRILGGALLAAMLAGLALFPVLRPQLARVIAPALNPRPAPTLTQKPDETDAAYLRRILGLAERGKGPAQLAVAEAYFYGLGTATNRVEAVKWYRRAAASGEADAMASLGLCSFRGWGCPKDVAAAVAWWRQAADRGSFSALSDLAFCTLNGVGVEKDEPAGFGLALRAAECGFAAAQTLVGECYLDGRGVEANVERGETWLYRAARQGNRRAKLLLRTR